jgi:hypothetical protein
MSKIRHQFDFAGIYSHQAAAIGSVPAALMALGCSHAVFDPSQGTYHTDSVQRSAKAPMLSSRSPLHLSFNYLTRCATQANIR